jgi:hypothetical protein
MKILHPPRPIVNEKDTTEIDLAQSAQRAADFLTEEGNLLRLPAWASNGEWAGHEQQQLVVIYSRGIFLTLSNLGWPSRNSNKREEACD